MLHDSEILIEVEHCHDPGKSISKLYFCNKCILGCYETSITYVDAQSEDEIPKTQIESLIELSEFCVPSFYYDCTLGIWSKQDYLDKITFIFIYYDYTTDISELVNTALLDIYTLLH